MFKEVSFEEKSIDETHEVPSSSTAPSALSNVVESCLYTLRYHKPGEDGFCSVANGEGEGEGTPWVDSRTINGDSWVGKECHCTRCECMRVIAALNRLERPTEQPLVLVLLDLDNFGFNQFKSVPPVLKRNHRGHRRHRSSIRKPRTDAAGDYHEDDSNDEGKDCCFSEVNVYQHMFVWAFFGSCFARYHGIWPSEEAVSQTLEQRQRQKWSGKAKQLFVTGTSTNSMSTMTLNPLLCSAQRLTVWQRLVATSRVHFTACGGQDQGADGVITSVINTFIQRDIVLITSDTKLIRHIACRDQGDGGYTSTGRLCAINVGDVGKRFVPVWRALSNLIRQLVIEYTRKSKSQ
ncbi:unnamed protein product [Phytomonas sp. Hart1]|nr:unnamed protein product [Phytomonas sp. Hart1]|eukprot:CCW70643.1 unnamed protein product [Phytomonas sp. isolate Hart1]